MGVEALLGSLSRSFPIDAGNIEVLESPTEFLQCLCNGIKHAKRDVTLCALYCGMGEAEEETLWDCIQESKVNIRILFDAQRALRPVERNGPSSVDSILKRLFHSDDKSGEEGRIEMHLFHSPLLRGIIHRALPVRIREIVGVQHMKMYVFDDSVLLSGANLSETYFTNRQDRYILFKNAPELANFVLNVFNEIIKSSYQVIVPALEGGKALNAVSPQEVVPQYGMKATTGFVLKRPVYDPVLQPYIFCSDLRERLERIILPKETDEHLYKVAFPHKYQIGHVGFGVDDMRECMSGGMSGVSDTLIFPTFQAGFARVRQDEVLTLGFLRYLAHYARQVDGPMAGELWIATPYMNFSASYEHAFHQIPHNIKMTILTSSMESNGFYQSKGISSNIPHAYSYLEKKLWRKMQKSSQYSNYIQNSRILREFHHENSEFHAKGMYWKPFDRQEPMVLTVGSSNYGRRSLNRDLELQAFIVTRNEGLKSSFEKEWNHLISKSRVVEWEDLMRRKGPYLSRLAGRFLRSFL